MKVLFLNSQSDQIRVLVLFTRVWKKSHFLFPSWKKLRHIIYRVNIVT